MLFPRRLVSTSHGALIPCTVLFPKRTRSLLPHSRSPSASHRHHSSAQVCLPTGHVFCGGLRKQHKSHKRLTQRLVALSADSGGVISDRLSVKGIGGIRPCHVASQASLMGCVSQDSCRVIMMDGGRNPDSGHLLCTIRGIPCRRGRGGGKDQQSILYCKSFDLLRPVQQWIDGHCHQMHELGERQSHVSNTNSALQPLWHGKGHFPCQQQYRSMQYHSMHGASRVQRDRTVSALR